jgi:hypothetical protein
VRASNEVRAVVAAGGLGTRVHHWARYLPKEFYPVGGRPGIAWILEEIAGLGAGRVVIVYHPYYRAFTEWAGHALSHSGQTGYRRAAGWPIADRWTTGGRRISFIAQHGRYGDLTSVLNGADHFPAAGDLYVAFADNLYFGPNPLRALRNVPPGQVAVVARPYQSELAAQRGVIATACCSASPRTHRPPHHQPHQPRRRAHHANARHHPDRHPRTPRRPPARSRAPAPQPQPGSRRRTRAVAVPGPASRAARPSRHRQPPAGPHRRRHGHRPGQRAPAARRRAPAHRRGRSARPAPQDRHRLGPARRPPLGRLSRPARPAAIGRTTAWCRREAQVMRPAAAGDEKCGPGQQEARTA